MSSTLLHYVVIAIIAVAIVTVVRFEVFCLTDIAHTRDDELRYLTRAGWIAVCLVTIPLGGICYLVYGRQR